MSVKAFGAHLKAAAKVALCLCDFKKSLLHANVFQVSVWILNTESISVQRDVRIYVSILEIIFINLKVCESAKRISHKRCVKTRKHTCYSGSQQRARVSRLAAAEVYNNRRARESITSSEHSWLRLRLSPAKVSLKLKIEALEILNQRRKRQWPMTHRRAMAAKKVTETNI